MNMSHKRGEISWLAEQLLDSQGGVSKNQFYKICYSVYSEFVSSFMLQRKKPTISTSYSFTSIHAQKQENRTSKGATALPRE
jgi:hypothetical protein